MNDPNVEAMENRDRAARRQPPETELERAAREARKEAGKIVALRTHSGFERASLERARKIRDRLDAALDESEGHGERGAWKDSLSIAEALFNADLLNVPMRDPGPTHWSDVSEFDKGRITREVCDALSHTPDPSDGEEGGGDRTKWLCEACGWTGDCQDLNRTGDNLDPACPRCGNASNTLLPPEDWSEQCRKSVGPEDPEDDGRGDRPTPDTDGIEWREPGAWQKWCPKCGKGMDQDQMNRHFPDCPTHSNPDPEIEFRATECNDDPITAPLSEVQEHRSWPVCPACNSITCREPIGEVPGLTIGSDADPEDSGSGLVPCPGCGKCVPEDNGIPDNRCPDCWRSDADQKEGDDQ